MLLVLRVIMIHTSGPAVKHDFIYMRSGVLALDQIVVVVLVRVICPHRPQNLGTDSVCVSDHSHI